MKKQLEIWVVFWAESSYLRYISKLENREEFKMKTTVVKNRRKPNPLIKSTGSQHRNGQLLALPISSQQIIIAVKKMKKSDRLAFLENLLAATSPEYLASIREAREDYHRGRVLSHEKAFNKNKMTMYN